MLLPDMFDEKVALMAQEEEELLESRGTEQGRLIALKSGQLVTLFTTGPEVHTTVTPVEVVLDDTDSTARWANTTTTCRKNNQSARIILHAPGNSDYKRPQLTDTLRERDAAGETRTRALPSFISNAIRRKPWTLGIAGPQTLPPQVLPRTASKTASVPSGTEPLTKDGERMPDDDDVTSDNGADGDDESDRIESASEISWFGGMARWASKFWGTKRVERLNTPRDRE